MTTEKESAPPRGTLLKPVAGKARPRMEALAEFNTWVHERQTGIPPVLRVLLLARAEDQFRWRVELDCGCNQEVLTNGRDQFPDDRHYYDPVGQADLPVGQMWCVTDHKDPKPYRDVVRWGKETVHEFPADPEVDPYGIGQDVWARIRHAEPHRSASWWVELSCGHYGNVPTSLGWTPEDGPTLASVDRAQEMLEEFEEYWRTEAEAWPLEGFERDHMRAKLEQRWPRPKPDLDCYTCTQARRIVGYQRIGWLIPRLKQPTPAAASRAAIEVRLKRAEAEAERLRRELETLR